MADALSIGHLCNFKLNPIFDLRISKTRRDSKMLFIKVVSCHNRDPNDPLSSKTKKDDGDKDGNNIQSKSQQFLGGVQRFGRDLKHNLSPQKKGDWKDITLMSISFAVYVYMSQKIVCAYCAWMSMIRQPW